MQHLDTTLSLSMLKDIASSVMYAAEADTVEQVLQRIADVARELLRARYAALGVPDGEGGLRVFKVSGLSAHQISRIHHPPVGKGLLGVIMNERTAVRLPHMGDDPRAVGFPEGHPPMESFLGVPIQVGEQLFGMLYLTDREDGQPFNIGDQWLLETLAGYAALAIAGSQLRDQGKRLTLLEERQRIGMELHDGIIQSLYALGMHLDLIRSQIDAPPGTFQPIIDGLNTVIEDIRTFIMDLRRRADGDKSCRELLERVITHLYIPDELEVYVSAPSGPAPFDHNDAESLCMIVREALSNVVRHAQARTVYVNARENGNMLQIVIRDDGQGFDLEELVRQNGLGVHNMRERARLHGGRLSIESAPGQGTTITLTVPTP